MKSRSHSLSTAEHQAAELPLSRPSLSADFTIAAEAALGDRDVTVTTPRYLAT